MTRLSFTFRLATLLWLIAIIGVGLAGLRWCVCNKTVVRGSLTYYGTPIQFAKVVCVRTQEPSVVYEGRSTIDGTFTLRREGVHSLYCVPGTYDVFVGVPESADFVPSEVRRKWSVEPKRRYITIDAGWNPSQRISVKLEDRLNE